MYPLYVKLMTYFGDFKGWIVLCSLHHSINSADCMLEQLALISKADIKEKLEELAVVL